MSRRAARCTEADYARAIRAAQKTGAGPVRALPDGTIIIDVAEKPEQQQHPATETNEWDVVT
jgi:hypothetical protein